jgi:hypothetical protein
VDPVKMLGEAGATETAVRPGVTVSVAAPCTPLRVAVIAAEPAATPVDEVQVTVAVTSPVELSL